MKKPKAQSRSMEWISVEEQMPRFLIDILFTDEENVYVGWLENYDPEEETSFYNILARDAKLAFPEHITHWMYLPHPPNPKVKKSLA